MRSQKEIQKNIHTKKSLGQNFLKNESIARELARAADIGARDVVIEVGPGKGMITKILLEKAEKVIAVEKDKALVEYLKKEFAQEIKSEKLTLVHGDILTFEPRHWSLVPEYHPAYGGRYGAGTGHWSLVGSIPYYITGTFLRRFLSIDPQPQTIALIIQKEVAQRIVAKDKKEGLFSLSVKAYGTPRYVKTVKAGSFYPKPKVDSAILVIENISRTFFDSLESRTNKNKFYSNTHSGSFDGDSSEQRFFELLKIGFGSKRKKLTSNLKKIHKDILKDIFVDLKISSDARAEDLTLEQWRKLYLKLMFH